MQGHNSSDSVKDTLNKIVDLLADDKFAAAEKKAVEVVAAHGPEIAEQLYKPLWQYATAKGRSRLRSYIFQEQSLYNWKNQTAEQLKNRLLVIASERPPVRDRPLSERSLKLLLEDEEFSSLTELWEGCFRLLHEHLVTGNMVTPPSGAAVLEGGEPVILTSGSGRSGSSAVFDWLNCFNEVHGSRRQYHHLRDLIFILDKAPGSTDYRTALVLFFFRTFLGYSIYTGKSAYLRSKLARDLRSRDLYGDIPRLFMNLLGALSLSLHSSRDKWGALPQMLSYLVQLHKRDGYRFAATGWLDFDVAEVFASLPNAQILCSVRDPRDVFAEHLLLTKGFNANVKVFISDYLCKMNALEKALKRNRGNVTVVQFEEFVASDNVRREIATHLNLDMETPLRTTGNFVFDPKVSMKNIGVYKRCRESKKIAEIQDKLGQYCITR